ncbi:MAG: aldose 1-epimerase family protein [Lachnospiraceae bacterium]
MIITIQNKMASASIDTKGAQLCSFKDHTGKEYIWCQDPTYWGSSAPVLFPMIGNVRNGKTYIENKEYALPKHGIVRHAEFEVYAQSENSVTFVHRANDDTLKLYPYRYALYVTFSLQNESLTCTMKAENCDDKTMYYHIGGHPAFNCPLYEGEKFEDYSIVFEEIEDCYSPVVDVSAPCIQHAVLKHHLNNSREIPLQYSLFDSDALIFTGLKSKKVSILNRNTQKGIDFDFENFHTVAFWSPIGKEAPFICIEPWNGSAIFDDEDDIFNHKRDILSLEPGQSNSFSFKVTPIN